MNYSHTLSLDCPNCITVCQFQQIGNNSHFYCKESGLHQIAYVCTHCGGVIVTHWESIAKEVARFKEYKAVLNSYFPCPLSWKPKVKLSNISNTEVKEDFLEAIKCFNYGLYNAAMVMARRSMQQEMLAISAEGDNLYSQIESTGISKNLKVLLQKIKNFGNHGAHPDFCLFDIDGKQLVDKETFARLSLEFLDKYFSDVYEIESLIKSAPRSEKELEK